eukprot:gene15193-16760_t
MSDCLVVFTECFVNDRNGDSSGTVKIGQRDGLSEIDIKQIKKAFKCSDAPQPGQIQPTTQPPKTTAQPPSVTKQVQPGQTTKPPTTAGPPSSPAPNVAKTTIVPPTKPETTTAPTNSAPPQQTKPAPTMQPQPTAPIAVNPDNNAQAGNAGKLLVTVISNGATAVSQGGYPSWPNDFAWNTNGMPQNCNCQQCKCRCLQINEPSAGAEWKNNFLCYKNRSIDPKIQWSFNGPMIGKRCTHVSDPTFGKYWDNNFICVPKNSPYRFAWSSNGPLNKNKFSCLKMNIPEGPKEWRDNYLCAIQAKHNKIEEKQ